ncbi:MAG: SprB repeat-containing protein [Bacteroidota bacterium]|nr:MAG: SprB repeat-containing protein [Bacteroidota bacterium]
MASKRLGRFLGRGLVTLLCLLSVGISQKASAQCSAMTISNSTPSWNGTEVCTGYDPALINAPLISYIGICTNTPSYNYSWQRNINGAGWTTVSTGTGVAIVPGYNPPAVINTPAGSPMATHQWRLIVTDVANGGLAASLTGFILYVGSQMTSSATTSMSCNDPVNGAIDLTVNGGISGTTYSWSGPGAFSASTEDISGLAAGTYTVVISDGACTNLTATYVVSAAGNLLASISASTNILCKGDNTGSATVTPSGGAPIGSPTYNYAWSPSGKRRHSE